MNPETKKMKDNYINQVNQEIRRYDLEDMKVDINYKVAKIVNDIKKSERVIINDEKRNLR